MAKFHRDFLVPYLHDIYALYLVDWKLSKEIADKQALIQQYNSRRYVPEPSKPRYESESGGCLGPAGLAFAVMSAFALIGIVVDSGVAGLATGYGFIVVLAMLLGGGTYWGVAKEKMRVEEENRSLKEEYEKELQDYEEEVARAEDERARRMTLIPKLEREIRELRSERSNAQQTLRYVYGANIIPTHYRNFYAAVFLYDWFSNGRSSDMDMALNTFVLEEIKEKLDVIIDQQAQMILNQRVMIANQQKSQDDQDRHNRLMFQKMDQIQATQEKRLDYERMIEANTAATAFFAAANYLK